MKIPIHFDSHDSMKCSSKHMTQNAPIMCTVNSEHVQSQDRAEARLQLWTELRCQLSEIHDLKLQSLFSKRPTDSNVRFMTCLDFFPFHHITATVYRKCRAVCVGSTWPVKIKCKWVWCDQLWCRSACCFMEQWCGHLAFLIKDLGITLK